MDDPIVTAYYSYMVDIAVMFGAERKTASEQLKESLLLEIEMAKVSLNIVIYCQICKDCVWKMCCKS